METPHSSLVFSVELRDPTRVVRQFGWIQSIPLAVDFTPFSLKETPKNQVTALQLWKKIDKERGMPSEGSLQGDESRNGRICSIVERINFEIPLLDFQPLFQAHHDKNKTIKPSQE